MTMWTDMGFLSGPKSDFSYVSIHSRYKGDFLVIRL